jgi:hypothetical protein
MLGHLGRNFALFGPFISALLRRKKLKEGAQKNLGPKRFQNEWPFNKEEIYFAGHGAPGV